MRFGKRLFFWFSFFMLSAASIYCLVLITGFIMPTETALTTSSGFTDTSKAEHASKAQSTEQNQSSQKQISSETSKAVTAASKGTAKGKIINKTVDPKTANFKYQKIYINNKTSFSINLKSELLAGPKLRIQTTNEPQVLIVHTHTTETFMLDERDYYTDNDLTRTTDDTKNIVAVGNVLCDTLIEKGIGVVHASEKHDYPEYTGSYTRAADTIKKYLQKHPTIKVVIDLHRDAIQSSDGTKTAVVSEVEGKKAAQLMIVAGCEDGNITDFPNWKENFRLAIKLQQSLEVMYPSLARPILFIPRKYNQNLTTGSLLIECGTDANTLEQAKYSAELLGNALASTLNMLKE